MLKKILRNFFWKTSEDFVKFFKIFLLKFYEYFLEILEKSSQVVKIFCENFNTIVLKILGETLGNIGENFPLW